MSEFVPDINTANHYFKTMKEYEQKLEKARWQHGKHMLSDDELIDIEQHLVPLCKKAIIAYNDYMKDGWKT